MHRIANDKVINQQVQRGWNICLYQKTLLLVEYRGSVSFQNLIVSFPISKQCIQQQETACMCVTEYCYLYLAFSRIDWVLNYIMREQWVDRVIFLYQHKVSMNECRRCESAADLVHFSSSAIKATVLQCSTLHPSVHNKKKKVESRAPTGHQPSDTCVYESQPQCQHRDQNMHHTAASHTPAEQRYLSTHRQHRPGNILTIDCTVTLIINFFFDCTF